MSGASDEEAHENEVVQQQAWQDHHGAVGSDEGEQAARVPLHVNRGENERR
jgi:hypothetical protein